MTEATISRAELERRAAARMELNRRHALGPEPECCVFFINNYLMTFDPRPEVEVHDIDFKLYPFQEEYVADLINAIRKGEDIFDEKSRDMGASWLALAVRFWLWIREDGYQSKLGSRKEEYVDNGMPDSLFGKIDYLTRTIKDPLLLPKGFSTKHRTYMKLINPVNGNTISGESSNPNFSRAGRYTDILMDEIGFWPDAKASWTAAGESTRCRHAVTTPPNVPSYAKVIRYSGKTKVRTWHWRRHPHKDDEWYENQKTRKSEEEMLHEIDISWEYSSSGRPYPEIDKVPVGLFQYDPTLPLYASIDLGLDAIAVGWYQPIRNSDMITMIDAYEANDKEIEWFLPFFGKDIDSRFTYSDADLEMIEHVKLWKPPTLFGDPSGNQRHVESRISPYKIMASNGLPVKVNTLENDWLARRDATKGFLRKLRINETPRTKWFIECMSNARYPKRPDESQTTTPIMKPVHDWTSHHRTQIEFFSVNYKPRKGERQPRKQPQRLKFHV
jgi:hypothetical protein